MNDKLYYLNNAKKYYGQNFLIDKNIINSIVNIINPKNEDVLVEIGPGLGALTQPICEIINNLIVIELDYKLTCFLKKQTIFKNKLNIFQQDVMTFDFFNIAKEKCKKIRIFGNLPYNISVPVLFYLFNHISSIQDMHFMLQKEVADRLTAKPNSKKYSKLTILAQYFCKIIPLIEVSPKSFIPVPKVNSIMVRLIPYIDPYYPIVDIYKLKYIVKTAFSKRRKILSNSLNCVFKIEILNLLNINPMLRAENLSIIQYCKLANWLSKNKN